LCLYKGLLRRRSLDFQLFRTWNFLPFLFFSVGSKTKSWSESESLATAKGRFSLEKSKIKTYILKLISITVWLLSEERYAEAIVEEKQMASGGTAVHASQAVHASLAVHASQAFQGVLTLYALFVTHQVF
jgi:hypothetical protein